MSLDAMLCPHLINEFQDEDWAHIVCEDFRLDYFYHLDYLKQRIQNIFRRNILGLYRNPEVHIVAAPSPGDFSYVGYDLIEEQTQVSALTNCGGFPDVFRNDELNRFGLFNTFDRACEVRRLLAERHPDEPHAQCELYAIWRLNETEPEVQCGESDDRTFVGQNSELRTSYGFKLGRITRMPRIHQTSIWQVHVPDAWNSQGTGEVAMFFRPDGVGMLMIATDEEAPPDLSGDALERHVRGGWPATSTFTEVSCGKVRGITAARTERGTFWRCWWVPCRGRLVYASYQCAATHAESEISEINEILQTIGESGSQAA